MSGESAGDMRETSGGERPLSIPRDVLPGKLPARSRNVRQDRGGRIPLPASLENGTVAHHIPPIQSRRFRQRVAPTTST
jgi:hypothetical protein